MNATPSAGERAFQQAAQNHYQNLPPLNPEQLKAVQDLQNRLEQCVNKGPRGTDNAVAALRAFASVAGSIPGLGTIAALVVNGVATGVDVAGGLARGVSLEQIARDVASGAASTGISALPGAGLAQGAGLLQGPILRDEASDRVMKGIVASIGDSLRGSGVIPPPGQGVCHIRPEDYMAIAPTPPAPAPAAAPEQVTAATPPAAPPRPSQRR